MKSVFKAKSKARYRNYDHIPQININVNNEIKDEDSFNHKKES